MTSLIEPIKTKKGKKNIKEYNTYIKDTKDINSICSNLIDICSERYCELSRDEYSKIK